MYIKEKLVELLEGAESAVYWNSSDKGFIEKIADHLIENGVTVQKWIPVTKRLPEKNTAVIVATDRGDAFQCLYAYDGWDLWEGHIINITHWMPLPEPPKEG